jgi:predicted Zn finger-like uncharacterized protein
MILSCKSCEKKFVVPDQAITAEGRTVQCGSCGNKWKQFPIKIETSTTIFQNKDNKKKIPSKLKSTKPKKKKIKKSREIDLYSPEYLAKKHGITLNNINNNNTDIITKKVSFGFYNSLILLIVLVITFSRGLYFFKKSIVEKFPVTEFYLNYFFESIQNIFEILKNLL